MFNANNVKITGTGSFVPENIITNKDLEKKVDTSTEWIYKKLGIQERRVVSNGEYTSDLAVKAALKAIENANIDKNEIDLTIVATATPDRKAPSTACLVKSKIRINNVSPAFDISAVCSGFMYALSMASHLIQSEAYEKILIVGADTFSTITDWDRRDCVFFGDGAGAIILEKSNYEQALFSSVLYSESSSTDIFTVFSKDKYFTMDCKGVFNMATKVLPETIQIILNKNNLSVKNIDHIIPHQPAINILKRIAKILDIPFDIFHTNMQNYANTSGATIPILLDEVHRARKLKKDDIIIFAGVGSGWTWGAGVYRWH